MFGSRHLGQGAQGQFKSQVINISLLAHRQSFQDLVALFCDCCSFEGYFLDYIENVDVK